MNRVDVEAALHAIVNLAARRPAFTTDDVWEVLPDVEDGRAIANAFMRAEQSGVIRNSRIGAYRRGHQAHRRWLSVWLSNAVPSTLEDAAAYASTPEQTAPFS